MRLRLLRLKLNWPRCRWRHWLLYFFYRNIEHKILTIITLKENKNNDKILRAFPSFVEGDA